MALVVYIFCCATCDGNSNFNEKQHVLKAPGLLCAMMAFPNKKQPVDVDSEITDAWHYRSYQAF